MSATKPQTEIKIPHNAEYERLVLGAALLAQKPDYWLEIAEQLRRDDFFLGSSRAIYAAFQSLAMRGADLSPLTVADELRREGNLDAIGGAAFVAALTDGVPSRVRFDTEIRRLRDLSVKRWAMKFGSHLVDLAQADDEESEAILERAERAIIEARGGVVVDDLIDSKTAVERALAELRERWANPNDAPGIRTGFADLDRITQGLRPRKVYLLAARPGEGKTTFALNVAHNACQHRRNQQPVVMIVSLEMGVDELTMRALSTWSRIPADAMTDPAITPEEQRRIIAAGNDISALNVEYIEPKSSLLVSTIKANLQRLKRRRGRVDLVIVDYVQLLSASKSTQSENDRLTEISRSIKLLAMSANVPILLLAQMNRDIEKRGKVAEPQLSDLRGSGSLEQDADLVMFLHDPSGEEDYVHRQLLIRKHRGGKTGKIDLLWFKDESRFESEAK